MSIDVAIVDGPLPRSAPTGGIEPRDDAGAVVAFDGVVRGMEDGQAIVALDYTAYEPMALESLWSLAEQAMKAEGMVAVWVRHSRGRVKVGEASFRLVMWSRHRAPALAAMGTFINAMKRDTPIWKKAVSS